MLGCDRLKVGLNNVKYITVTVFIVAALNLHYYCSWAPYLPKYASMESFILKPQSLKIN